MREYSHSSNFWRHVRKDDVGCWEWTGNRNSLGYGRVSRRLNGKLKSFYAHRVSFQLSFGPIPEGLEVCHKCDNPCCVRPDHLWLGTQAENNRDRHLKGRTARVPEKTHCRNGHPFDSVNTRFYVTGSGIRYRVCRTCDRKRGRYGVDR